MVGRVPFYRPCAIVLGKVCVVGGVERVIGVTLIAGFPVLVSIVAPFGAAIFPPFWDPSTLFVVLGVAGLGAGFAVRLDVYGVQEWDS